MSNDDQRISKGRDNVRLSREILVDEVASNSGERLKEGTGKEDGNCGVKTEENLDYARLNLKASYGIMASVFETFNDK